MDGAVCRLDKAGSTITVIPWSPEKGRYDPTGVRTFKLTPATVVTGKPPVTVGELNSGKATTDAYKITGCQNDGGMPFAFESFKIKNLAQLLHRRATVSWTVSAATPKADDIQLVNLYAGESIDCNHFTSDDVILSCEDK